MPRRLVALAVILFVSGAPLVADICAANCAEHARHAARQAVGSHGVNDHASHHHHAGTDETPATTASIRAIPHPCASSDAVVTQSRESLRLSVERPLAAPTAVFIASPVARTVNRALPIDAGHGPPTSLPALSALRI